MSYEADLLDAELHDLVNNPSQMVSQSRTTEILNGHGSGDRRLAIGDKRL